MEVEEKNQGPGGMASHFNSQVRIWSNRAVNTKITFTHKAGMRDKGNSFFLLILISAFVTV